MRQIELTAPCNFGVEAVLARELKNLGFEVKKTNDGRVDFLTDEAGICRANLWLRSAERVLLKMGEFNAASFEQLFEETKKIDWTDWLPKDGQFPVVKATSLKSALFSTPDIQAIVKKAVVEKMKAKYQVTWFEESGDKYPIHVFLYKDVAHIYLDTSGISLHKRGYRVNQNMAPIKETLAFAMVDLTPWREDRPLIDPLCGSGTILIEAALKGINKAPGIGRRFLAETWANVPETMWRQSREEAQDLIRRDLAFLLQGYDNDGRVLAAARENATAAGVAEYIHFQERDVRQLHSRDKYGFIVTNPPYGERMEDKTQVEQIYREMGKTFKVLDTWSYSIITTHENFENLFGRKADKKRKLYNGMLKATLYQYFGPKPPKREKDPTETANPMT